MEKKQTVTVIKHVPMSIAQFISLGGDVNKIQDKPNGSCFHTVTQLRCNILELVNDLVNIKPVYRDGSVSFEEKVNITDVWITIALPITTLPDKYL